MEIRKIGLSLAVITALGLGFTGCGSSDSSSSDDTSTGTFVDAPVAGLHYITATQDGYTDSNGNFKYKAGETVEFKLGTLSFGKVEAGGLISPYTMADVAVGATSDKATNIALLLQNFDANRSNSDVLDLSKLKDYNFSDVNLSDTPNNMETKISAKITTLANDGLISNDATLIDSTTVTSTMKTYVETKQDEVNDFKNIIGKTYNYVECSALFGCEKDASFSYNSNGTISGLDFEENKNFTENYTVQDNDLIKIVWDEEDTEYTKILTVSSDMVTACSKDSEDEALNCTTPNQYFITSSSVDAFIATKNASMADTMLTDKTSVTSLSDIEGQTFWQIESYNNSRSVSHFSVESNGDLNGTLEGSTYDQFGDGSHYNVALSDGSYHLTGYDAWDEEDVDTTSNLYKYPLKDKSITSNNFANSSVFDNQELSTLYPNKVFTFTKGYIYCDMLWSECWLDQDAYDEMNAQAN